jgi:hypothetical protein
LLIERFIREKRSCVLKSPRLVGVSLLAVIAIPGCAPESGSSVLNGIADDYVRLVLAMGEHDADYVDAYFGPEEWQDNAGAEYPTLDAIRAEAERLLDELKWIETPGQDVVRRRIDGLEKRLIALDARIDIVSGKTLPFDEETRLLFDAIAPDHDAAYFDRILERLDALLPGDGDLIERALRFRAQFVIPPDRLEAVFAAAIEECRRRTVAHIELPENEDFTLEYVIDKPWSGYNWFKGNAFSLIQINTDLPRHIDRAVDLGCHEGYPGHHTYGVLMERDLYKARRWVEFSVYALFSPQSLLSEGSANYGIRLAFPGEERSEFEKTVLYPLAGLDPAKADAYYEYLELRRQLSYARNEAARDYLDGTMNRQQAAQWIRRYSLFSEEEAQQSVDFIEKYRAYVINYNLGQDIVRSYIEREAGDDQGRRWELFEKLLSEPVSVADISRL